MPQLIKQLRVMTFRQKVEHIWEYYKWHIIATFTVLTLGSLFVGSVIAKEESFQIAIVDSGQVIDPFTVSDNLNRSFTEFNIIVDIIHSGNTLSSISAQDSQKLLVRAAAGDIDLLLLDEEIYYELLQQDPFASLENYIASSTLELSEESLFYGGESNVVYGINTSNIPAFKQFSNLQDKVLCVFQNASDQDDVKQFLTLILSD